MTATAQRPLPLQLAGIVGPLWQWWRREIVAMMPASLKQWIAGRQGRLVVAIARDRATILQELGKQRRRLGSFDLVSAQAGEVETIAASADGETVLELPAEAALRRLIALPAAAESNLAEVVSFELERHTPFRRAEVYHGFRPIGRDASRQRIQIELTVVPRAVVDDALARLARLGLDIGSVRVAAEGAGADASPDLMTGRQALRTPRLPRFAIAVLALTAAMLAAGVIAIPIVRAHRDASQLEAALQSAKQQADESVRLQKQIDAALSDRGFLAGRKRRLAPVSELLDTLTRLLPDDTWFTELRIGGADIDITGTSASASRIVALIDGAPGMSDATFRSPVTQDSLHQEQFDIGAHLGTVARK
jgi:general secretion pathway protein L